MVNHVDHPERLSVYYDDACELCERSAKKIRSETGVHTVGASGDLPPIIRRQDLMYEVHAMDENGVLYRGVDAIIVILRWHPTWFWIAPIIAFPGIKQIAQIVYRIVAANRYRWFGRR